MKVYVVLDDIQEGGVEVFHIASTKEKADLWIRDYYRKNPNSIYIYSLDVVEVGIDEEKRIVL